MFIRSLTSPETIDGQDMTVPEKYMIGIAGCGVFGTFHARKIGDMDNAVLAGFFDTDPVNGKCLASAHDAAFFEDFSSLPAICDGIVIATPAGTHYRYAKAALEAGCHVFVEKPLALKVEEARSLVNLADAGGLVLQVGHQERYVISALGLGQEEIVSSLRRVECVRQVPSGGRCTDVSVVFDLMIHDFDLVRQFVRSGVSSVQAAVEGDACRAEIVFQNGAIALFRAGRDRQSPARTMRLDFDDGVVEVDFMSRSVVNTTALNISRVPQEDIMAGALADPLAFGDRLFVSALAGSAPVPYVSGRDGLDAVAWACAVEDALLCGKSSDRLPDRKVS